MPPDPAPPALPGAIVVPAGFEDVRELAAWLRARCAEQSVPEAVVIDLELAVAEAATNIAKHGYGEHSSGNIGLDLAVAGSVIVVTLYDSGRPIPPGKLHQRVEVSQDALGGRGIPIIQACSDLIEYASLGEFNRLVLAKGL